ncbi:QRFP-like peptide receptor [Branchiostoma lanceolatum]|uniref:QRFPR protein n=1 Tax=Branchiostoma lanceolatum TaxID=7740 RepID=A0A8J9Z751_BRALA|nr:QRFPR [Branchiostoma lanceolatum]
MMLGNITQTILQELLRRHNITRDEFIDIFGLPPLVYVPELSPGARTVTLVFYIIIFLAALLGNILVVYVVWKNKVMRTTMNIFICSLAASDLFITIVCIPVTLMQNMLKNWILGDFMCKLVPFIQTIAVASSVLTLTGIAIERYYAIIHPLKVKYLLSKTRAGIILALVWAVSVGVATPMLFVHKAEEIHDFLYDQRYVTCQEKWWGPTQQTAYTIFNLVVLFIIPLLTMTSLYIRIAHRLWVQQPVGVISGNLAHGNSVRRKRQAIKMLVVVVLLFAVCWLPYHTVTVMNELTGLLLGEKSAKLLIAIVQLIAFSNSFNNPVVYAILNENFKKNFMAMLRCGVNRVSPQQVTPNTMQTPLDASTRSCRLPPQQQI